MAIYDDLEHDEYVAEMQELINSGQVWLMEGSLGRQAMSLIRQGFCVLGEEPCHNAYGGRVPSRFEVKTGTLGSIEYKQAITN
jgi:hypothetical protein